MEDIWPNLFDNFLQASLDLAHEGELREPWDACAGRGCHRCPVEMPTVDIFLTGSASNLFWGCQMKSFPAQPTLLAQDRQRAECITAMEWDRMIEDMQNSETHEGTAGDGFVESASMTLRRKASNMSSVHKDAL